MKNAPKTRTKDILIQQLENELLVYDLQTNQAFCLNKTSTLLYQLCDGTRRVAEISNLMTKEMKAKVSEDIVWLALDGLKKHNLLENAKEIPNDFKGLARREVVKRVGLASLIALPVISALAAPTAVYAASCANPGGAPGGTNVSGSGSFVGCLSDLSMQCCSGSFSSSQTFCPGGNTCFCSGRCA